MHRQNIVRQTPSKNITEFLLAIDLLGIKAAFKYCLYSQ